MSVQISREESKRVGGCNSCSYPDGERGIIYEMHISNLTVRLCSKCLNELEKGIEWLNKKKNGKN